MSARNSGERGVLAAVELAQSNGIGGERFIFGVGALMEEAGGLGAGLDGARILSQGERGLAEFEQGLGVVGGGAEAREESFVGLEGRA